jgi:alkanesulfonate monooxygenase SsuD/methylene tetrahydromethanopterin reductase-like flavin-dependent oxidoreductase (luciferase family)
VIQVAQKAEKEGFDSLWVTAHSFILETSGLPITAPFGFIPGLMLGLRKDDDDE